MHSPSTRAIGNGLVTVVILGTFVPVTGVLDEYPFFGGQMLRYAVAGAVLAVWGRRRGMALPALGGRDLGELLAVAVLGMVGFTACVLAAQEFADPGLVAAVVGASPLLLAMFGPLVEGRPAQPGVLLGAVVVVTGIALVAGVGSGANIAGIAFAVGALVCESSVTLTAVGLLRRIGPVATAACLCVMASMLCAVAGIVVEGRAMLRMPTGQELLALSVASLLVTCVGFVCWYRAVAMLGSDRAGLLVGLVPVTGLLASVLLGAQSLTLMASVGALVVGSGTVLGLRRSSSPAGGNTTRGVPAGFVAIHGPHRFWFPVIPGAHAPDT